MAVESFKVPIGSNIIPFDLPATDGKNYSVDSFKDAKSLVVAFSCNHCPYAKAAWPFLTKLAEEFSEKGVAFVAINPNDENQYPEDSFDQMKKRVVDWKIDFPYLRDESQKIARTYKAACTPDVFVYEKDRKLYYHGRINDNWQNPQDVKSEDLKDAINLLLVGDPPPQPQYPSLGCSIKWKE